jgi:hypothetical protein
MIDSEALEKLKSASIQERIATIEAIAKSIQTDLQKESSPQPEVTSRPAFGFMKNTGEILGDVVSPVLPESAWEALQ